MLIKNLKLTNFRGYYGEVIIGFENFTALIGHNDSGKSTIMEALEIFFNEGKGIIKVDPKDLNVTAKNEGANEFSITVVFKELPSSLILDATNQTTLKDEYLLNTTGDLEIIKRFQTTAKGLTCQTIIKAKHPTTKDCNNLLIKKQDDLIKIVDKLNLNCNRSINSEMRKAIWAYYEKESPEGLNLQDVELEINNRDELGKSIWVKLKNYLPIFSLFQSDRSNRDSDSEVQDPLREAIKIILSEPSIQSKLEDIANIVNKQVQDVADATLDKLQDLDPKISQTLHPNIPKVSDLKWADVFKSLSISGDQDIPINKRGSGVRRLILFSFFRVEAEKREQETEHQHIIYAIEEPETSQHKAYQQQLVESLKDLSNKGAQIIITTHSSDIVKGLKFEQIRLISKNNAENSSSKVTIENVSQQTLPYISLNEINCLAFGDYSVEYHNELYGFLQKTVIDKEQNTGGKTDYNSEKNFDKWLHDKQGCPLNKKWINDKINKTFDVTLATFIRNAIHHPENKTNNNPQNPNGRPYSDEELKASIKKMRDILNMIREN